MRHASTLKSALASFCQLVQVHKKCTNLHNRNTSAAAGSPNRRLASASVCFMCTRMHKFARSARSRAEEVATEFDTFRQRFEVSFP